MRFLIDGYNLLHALGMAPTPGLPSLERSRTRFLEWLATELGPDVAQTCVVFDAQHHHHHGHTDLVQRGIQLRFSRGETADDLIEKMVRAEQTPARLTVVSNDHSVQESARRRGCPILTCGEYVDWLLARTKRVAAESPLDDPEKPAAPSDAEMDEWLRRFGQSR